MKKQYLLKIQFADGVERNTWWIGARLDPWAKPGQRFYSTKKDAKAALKRLLDKANKQHTYNAKGERIETTEIANGIGADMVITKDLDDRNRIVNWSIQVREVTEWELVEDSKGGKK